MKFDAVSFLKHYNDVQQEYFAQYLSVAFLPKKKQNKQC